MPTAPFYESPRTSAPRSRAPLPAARAARAARARRAYPVAALAVVGSAGILAGVTLGSKVAQAITSGVGLLAVGALLRRYAHGLVVARILELETQANELAITVE